MINSLIIRLGKGKRSKLPIIGIGRKGFISYEVSVCLVFVIEPYTQTEIYLGIGFLAAAFVSLCPTRKVKISRVDAGVFTATVCVVMC